MFDCVFIMFEFRVLQLPFYNWPFTSVRYFNKIVTTTTTTTTITIIYVLMLLLLLLFCSPEYQLILKTKKVKYYIELAG